jgi:hypothetical protein
VSVPSSETVLLITRNGMGDAEPPLQQKLITTYLRLLEESGTRPGAICFYAEGVYLVAEGSPALDTLKLLEAKGVHLILCSTCLNYYGLTEKVRVGIVGGMTDIIEAQYRASKVITL